MPIEGGDEGCFCSLYYSPGEVCAGSRAACVPSCGASRFCGGTRVVHGQVYLATLRGTPPRHRPLVPAAHPGLNPPDCNPLHPTLCPHPPTTLHPPTGALPPSPPSRLLQCECVARDASRLPHRSSACRRPFLANASQSSVPVWRLSQMRIPVAQVWRGWPDLRQQMVRPRRATSCLEPLTPTAAAGAPLGSS
jgi:hypothetical protein